MPQQQQASQSRLADFLASFFAPELRAWHGLLPLEQVFWGYGICVSAAFALVYVWALYGEYLFAQQMMLLCFAGYTIWILVSVWRCAVNANPFWGMLARWLTMAWAVNAILILIFLQFDLLSRYLDL